MTSMDRILHNDGQHVVPTNNLYGKEQEMARKRPNRLKEENGTDVAIITRRKEELMFNTPEEFWSWFEEYCCKCATGEQNPFGQIHFAPVWMKLLELGVIKRRSFMNCLNWQKQNNERLVKIMKKVGKRHEKTLYNYKRGWPTYKPSKPRRYL